MDSVDRKRAIQVWRPSGRHGHPNLEILSGKRTTVFAPCPIVFRQDVAHWTRFYVAESEDCQSLLWERFKKEAKKHGLSRISKDSVRELNSKGSPSDGGSLDMTLPNNRVQAT